MLYERQISPLPTNKATTASVLSSIIMLYSQPMLQELWPQFAPQFLSGPATTTFVAVTFSAIASLAITWFVPDRVGIPTLEVDE